MGEIRLLPQNLKNIFHQKQLPTDDHLHTTSQPPAPNPEVSGQSEIDFISGMMLGDPEITGTPTSSANTQTHTIPKAGPPRLHLTKSKKKGRGRGINTSKPTLLRVKLFILLLRNPWLI